MTQIKTETFVCIDCEATGLDPEVDKIIEIAAVKFTFSQNIDSYETLIDCECLIPEISQSIHHISQQMIEGKPKIYEVLPEFLKFLGPHILVGHGITFDIAIIASAAKKYNIPCTIASKTFIDTLRLARLYGDSPINSLKELGKHFNIKEEGFHRAMSDVLLNIEVFKYLSSFYSTTRQLLEKLSRPIMLKAMPLGKHKGRLFSEIPIQYLLWAASKDFDQDLLFSIRSEINNRKKKNNFQQASNPFQNL